MYPRKNIWNFLKSKIPQHNKNKILCDCMSCTMNESSDGSFLNNMPASFSLHIIHLPLLFWPNKLFLLLPIMHQNSAQNKIVMGLCGVARGWMTTTMNNKSDKNHIKIWKAWPSMNLEIKMGKIVENRLVNLMLPQYYILSKGMCNASSMMMCGTFWLLKDCIRESWG